MDFLEKALNVIDNISLWCGKAASSLVVGLVFILCLDVVLRLFNTSTEWGLETSCMMLAAVSLLGSGYCLMAGHHVKVDIFYNMWRPRTRAIVDVFTQFALFSMCVVLFIYGGEIAVNSFINGDTSIGAWQYPLWPSQALVPIGALLLVLQGLAKWVRDLVTAITGEKKLESKVDLGMNKH